MKADFKIERDKGVLLGEAAKESSELSPSWSSFVSTCRSCTACPLAESRNNVVVFRGSTKAPLLILGEGPGRDEDLQGYPFCGRSGRLLDAALRALEFKADDIHVANMVKCRPPGNRAPTPGELEACRPLLREQFKLLQPKIILLLGNTAFQNFTGIKSGITKARGSWLESDGILLLPSFHPAYILRDPRRKPELFADLLTVRQKLEELALIEPMRQPYNH
ncbi:MAG: uracil-DNA glycosylase [Eubacteriales bacterium]|nr:uracil-DNA glycosylase [Eubacteriales bacterium]